VATFFIVAFPALATVLAAVASFEGLRAFGLAAAFFGDWEEERATVFGAVLAGMARM
jgi:hypothetical protein